MSEPSSLFARITITENAKEKFLNSTIEDSDTYNDWMPWLKRHQYYGKISQDEINFILNYSKIPVKKHLEMDEWLNPEETAGYSIYNKDEHTWILACYEFSENYMDFIGILHILRGIAKYKDIEGTDFILIHSLIWGNTDSDTAIQIKKGESKILESIPPRYIEEASTSMHHMAEIVASKYND